MRPVQLVMSAFGPFKDKVVIDFSQFNQASLFLLTGPTGSGKTTIFDAISYALYGSASGQVRDTSTLKSDYADGSQLCYVDFTFTLGEKTVQVCRQPKQIGPGKTKAGVQLHAEFNLKVDGQTCETKISESKRAMEDLLGLTADQFKQIVMLPQGEFRKLLTASSKDKEAIFRNIFKTDNFQIFEKILSDRYKSYKADLDNSQTKLDQVLDAIQVEDWDKNTKLCQAVKEEDYPSIMEGLGQEIDRDQAQVGALDQAIKKLEGDLNRLNKYIENRQELDRLILQKKDLNQAQDQIKAFQKSLDQADQAKNLQEVDQKRAKTQDNLSQNQQAKEKLDSKLAGLEKEAQQVQNQIQAHQEKLAAIPKMEANRQQLEKEKGLWQDLSQRFEALEALKVNQSQARDQEKDKLEKLKANQAAKADLDQKLQQLPQWRDKLKEAEAKKTGLDQAGQEADRKENDLAEALADARKIQAIKEEVKSKEAAFKEANQAYVKLGQAYFANQAALLADQLEEDQPCPVCGSTHHPAPAHFDQGEVTKSALDASEAAKNQAQADLTQVESSLHHRQEALAKALRPYQVSQSDLEEAHNQAYLDRKQLQEEAKKMASRIEDLNQALAQEPGWRDQVESYSQDIEALQADLQTLKTNLDRDQADQAKLEAEVEDLQGQLSQESKDQVEASIQDITAKIEGIRQREKDLQAHQAQVNQDLTQNRTSFNYTKDRIQELDKEFQDYSKEFNDLAAKSEIGSDYQSYLISDQEIDRRKNIIDQHQEAQIKVASGLENVKSKLPPAEDQVSLEEAKAQEEDLGRQKAGLQGQRDQVNVRKEANKTHLADIQKYYQEQASIYKTASLYKDLSDLAGGKSAETNRISFERYVLGVYFDEILQAANLRLDQMTSGRFNLERQRDNFKGSAGKGLDLEVFDQFTGKKRPVSSLSGGEMFKASLSLALGLSDVIQGQLGGVQVDTLFVDEGFGTLDPDSLDQAVQVLMELNQTGRLVGIISHVEELKARISSKIVLKRQQTGSQVEIEV